MEADGSGPCPPQAELISWSKGFSCSDVEGKDVVQLLQSAINKQEVEGCGVCGGWLGAAPMKQLMMLLLCPWPALPCASCRPVE